MIPKSLEARIPPDYFQKIPRIIWQTMKTNEVHRSIKAYTDTWINLNPEYDYRFYDDKDVREFIETYFPDFLKGYNKLKFGASKADLWRYLIIFKFGGIYVDIDCLCLNPLRNWVNPDASFVTQIGINSDICQWMIISEPGNPIFIEAAKKTVLNSETDSHEAFHYGFEIVKDRISMRDNVPLKKFNDDILALSGPPVLQEAAELCNRKGLLDEIFKNCQVVCVSGKKSCQMAGNVRHVAGPHYRRILREMKTAHYDSLTSKIKRKIFKMLQLLRGKM